MIGPWFSTLRSLCVLRASAVYMFFRPLLPRRRGERRDYAEKYKLGHHSESQVLPVGQPAADEVKNPVRHLHLLPRAHSSSYRERPQDH